MNNPDEKLKSLIAQIRQSSPESELRRKVFDRLKSTTSLHGKATS